jgi:hypothetical protein
MDDEIQALTELRAGVAARDRDAVEDAIGQLEFVVEDGAWPHVLFDGVRDLLHDSGFLAVQTQENALAGLRHGKSGLSDHGADQRGSCL